MTSVEIPRAKKSLRDSKETTYYGVLRRQERIPVLSQCGITSGRQRKLLKSKPTLKTVLHTERLHVASELDTPVDIASEHLKLRTRSWVEKLTWEWLTF